MNEEVYEGYDFLVMLIEKYREDSGKNFSVTTLNRKDLEVVEFGLKLEWLQHQRGATPIIYGSFIWTEKAEREISHLNE